MAEGTRLERYRLVRRLKPAAPPATGDARLAPQTIWHATDTSNGQEVVLKCDYKPIYPEIRDLLLDSQARDFAIVPLLDCFESNGLSVEVTPFFPDGTLAQQLAVSRNSSQAVRIDRAERLLGSMRRALSWLYEGNRRVVAINHNDIKPSNIFLDGDGYRLGDFGSASIRPTGRSGSNPVPATPSYAPPERFDGGHSEAGDCWSLGLTLAESILGHHPLAAPEAGGGVIVLDTADLRHDWRLAGAEFRSLPDSWRALLYGLTSLNKSQRWRRTEINQWCRDDEQVRAEAIADGLQIGAESDLGFANAYLIDGASVRNTASAAEAILRSRLATDVHDPVPLANWVEQECDRRIAAGAIRRSVEVADIELRRVRIALELNRNSPLMWRNIVISRNLIRDFARDEDETQLAWIASLRSSAVLELYSAYGNDQAREQWDDLLAAESRLNAAFQELRDNGCNFAIPDEAAQWRMACQIAFVPQYREYYTARLAHLSEATGLFARPAWISRIGGRFDQLNVEQLHALDWAERQESLLGERPVPTALDEIPLIEGTDEELHAAPLIWLKTQERLLGRMKVSDILEPVRLAGGDYYPQSAAGLPYHRVRRWLRQVIYPWFTRRLRPDPAERLRKLGAVGDQFNVEPTLHLSATLFQTRAKLDDQFIGAETYACEVRWAAPEGYDVQLVLRSPGLFRDSVIWKTPRHSWAVRGLGILLSRPDNRQARPSGLSRIGRMALSLCQDTVLTLEARPRLPLMRRPAYYSREITIVLPAAENKFTQPPEIIQDRFEPLKTDADISRPDLSILQVPLEQIRPGTSIGDGMNLSERYVAAERRTAWLFQAVNRRSLKFSKRELALLQEYYESRQHQHKEAIR